jgi:hypothetical protein
MRHAKYQIIVLLLSFVFLTPPAFAFTVNQWLNSGEILSLTFSTNADVISASGIEYDILVSSIETGVDFTDLITTNLYDGTTLLASNTGSHENVIGGEYFAWAKTQAAADLYSGSPTDNFGNPIIIPFTSLLDGTIQGKLDILLTTNSPVYIGYVQLMLGQTNDFGMGSIMRYGLDDELTITGSSTVPEPTTLLLLGSGLIGVIGYGRKRFKNC